MLDITGLITKATGRQFEIFSLPDFVPELIRRCRKEDLLFPLLDFLVNSVDNISAMEFKRYDSSCYQAARDASAWGKPDPSLEDTVNGILKFMHRKGIISVAPREFNAVGNLPVGGAPAGCSGRGTAIVTVSEIPGSLLLADRFPTCLSWLASSLLRRRKPPTDPFE